MSCLMRSNCSSAVHLIELPARTSTETALAQPRAVLMVPDSLRP